MFIATKVWFDPETFLPVVWDGYEYDGPVALCKKGRDEQAQNTAFQQGQAGINASREGDAYGKAQGILGEDIGSSTPGSLTPAAQTQLAADNDNISRTYNGMRQTAFASSGQRGFGGAPSGIGQTSQNALNVGEEGSKTGAYRNAQVNTQNQRNTALSGETALSGQQLQGELGNTNAATTSALDQSKMGSNVGDITGAIAGLAPIAAAPFTGGASLGLANALKNPFSSIGKGAGTGVGNYGGGGIG